MSRCVNMHCIHVDHPIDVLASSLPPPIGLFQIRCHSPVGSIVPFAHHLASVLFHSQQSK